MCESICGVILTWVELKKGKMSMEISKINYEIQKLGIEPGVTHSIGFALPDNEDEEEE